MLSVNLLAAFWILYRCAYAYIASLTLASLLYRYIIPVDMGNKRSRPATKTANIVSNATAKQLVQNKFIHACSVGDVDLVRRLLRQETTISVNDGTKTFGVTALLYACQNGHARIVALLLDEARDTIDVNQAAMSGIGASPLCIACSRGHARIVTLLLDKARDSIDVNQATEAGGTPLMMAADRGHTDIVVQLLNQPGIDCSKAWTRNDGKQFTPLSRAKDVGHDAIVGLLQSHAESNCN